MMAVAMATVYSEEEVQSGHNETMKVFTEVYSPSTQKLKKLWQRYYFLLKCESWSFLIFSHSDQGWISCFFKRVHLQKSLCFATRGTNRLPPTPAPHADVRDISKCLTGSSARPQIGVRTDVRQGCASLTFGVRAGAYGVWINQL